MSRSIPLKELLSYLAILLPTVSYLLLPFVYAVNVPNADDFDMLLASTIHLVDATTVADKFGVLFARHGEHYTVFSRLAAYLSVLTEGSLNFRTIVVVANFAIPIGVLFLYLVFRSNRKDLSLIPFLPAGFFILQPQYVESIMWASGVTQHLCIIPLAFAAFYFSQIPKAWAVVLTILLGLFAVFTQGNGIFILPTIGLTLLLQRRYGVGALLGVVGLSLCALHLGSLSGSFDALAQSDQSSFSVVNFALYTTAFLGSLYVWDFHGAVVLGAVLLLCYLALSLRRYPQRTPRLWGILTFLVLTAFANGLARLSLGVDYGFLNSRYKLISCLVLAVIWLIFVAGRSKPLPRGVHVVVLLVSVAFSSWSYVANHPDFILRHQLLRDSMVRWQVAGTGLEYPVQSRAVKILKDSIRRDLYVPGQIEVPLAEPLDQREQVPHRPVRSDTRVTVSVEHALRGSTYATVSGYAFLREKRSPESDRGETFIRLVGQSQQLLFRPERRVRPDVARHHGDNTLTNSGFFLLVHRKQLKEESYAVEIIVLDQNGKPSSRRARKRV